MRISVTELDAYRYYRDDEDADLEKLLRQLRREEPPTEAMLAGKAFHHVLEHADLGDISVAEHDGFRFRFDLNAAIVLPRVRELKGDMQVSTSVGPVVLVGVVDGLDVSVRDYKLTARFDAERYAASYQWRCYLVMFDAYRFDYEVFVAKHDENSIDRVIYEHHRLTFFSYLGIRDDVMREVDEFARFVDEHLPERRMKAAA